MPPNPATLGIARRRVIIRASRCPSALSNFGELS